METTGLIIMLVSLVLIDVILLIMSSLAEPSVVRLDSIVSREKLSLLVPTSSPKVTSLKRLLAA